VTPVVASSPTAFAAAVAQHPFAPYTFAPEALRAAASALAETGLLVLGETHGIRETPSVVYALAVELGARAVAFEWSHEEMDEPLQGFVREGAFDLERLWSLPPTAELFCGDGRITAGHFALLARLHEEGHLDQAIAFDRLDSEPPTDWPSHVRIREPELASRLLAEWDGWTPMLVVTGAFHAQLESPDGDPMAAYLARRLPSLRPAMLQHEPGPLMPPAPIVLRVGEATPAVVPGPATRGQARA
jgi:hypothetical protein